MLSSFARWINEQRENTGKPHIAFDGKTLRGSGKRSGSDALHLMSAMVVDSGLVLTQQESLGKKNEIKTMQAMLQSLEVKGTCMFRMNPNTHFGPIRSPISVLSDHF